MAKFIPSQIIVHHSLTKDSGTVSWGAIRRFHTNTLKWKDIGYHVGCELVKSGNEADYEVLMGRTWTEPGAHTKGQNSNSLAFCFIGNFDELLPLESQLITGAKVIALWLDLFGLSINNIYSHHNFAPHKSCPGTHFNMETLKECVRRCYD